MDIDPRLNDIDDCLYRVAIRVLVVEDDRVLLVQELPERRWAFPGGGIEHGETVESSVAREVTEELGVPPGSISSNFQIVCYDIGKVVNGVPRMNLFYKVSVPAALLAQTAHVADWKWCTKAEFLALTMHPSYDKTKLAKVIFDE